MFPVGTACYDGEVFGVCVTEFTAPGEGAQSTGVHGMV